MNDRMIDYYVKGLSFDERQRIFNALEAVGTYLVEKLLEKPQGYPTYRSMYYDDEDIASQERKGAARFATVNEIIRQSRRPPLFPQPDDTYASAERYVALMRRYRRKESDTAYPDITDFGHWREPVAVLEGLMGCRWEDYQPEEIES